MQFTTEEDLRYMIHRAPIGICILDAGTLTIQTANAHLLKLLDRPGENLTGKSYREILTIVSPDEELALKMAKDGRPYSDHKATVMRMLDGKEEILPATLVYSPIKNNQGKVTLIVVWVLENTEQALNEELAAINEELATTNEEYAAANEELAAANEELPND